MFYSLNYNTHHLLYMYFSFCFVLSFKKYMYFLSGLNIEKLCFNAFLFFVWIVWGRLYLIWFWRELAVLVGAEFLPIRNLFSNAFNYLLFRLCYKIEYETKIFIYKNCQSPPHQNQIVILYHEGGIKKLGIMEKNLIKCRVAKSRNFKHFHDQKLTVLQEWILENVHFIGTQWQLYGKQFRCFLK